MVFNCKGFYFDEENQEALPKSSAGKRAEELPAAEKSKRTRGSRAKRVVPVVNDNTESRQQDSENSELSLPQLEGNYGSDFTEPHQKIENSGNQKTQKEHSSPLHLRVGMHCKCDGCAQNMKKIFKKFKGVGTVKIHRDKELVEVTGIMDTNKLVVYLEEKLRRDVEVMPIQNNEKGANPTQKHGAGVRHITNITDNASRGKEVYPAVRKLEEQNLEKTELTSPQPRRRDRNCNEGTGMVLLKIGTYCLEGCIQQTLETIKRLQGVELVKFNKSKDLVIVADATNVKEHVAYLEKMLKLRVEIVFAPNEDVTGDNKEVEVTKTETLKGPAAAREDGRNKDVKIKREVRKEAKEIRIKQKVEDKVKEAKGHGYVSHVGEADRQTKNQQPCSSDCWTNMFSDENPHSCAIM
ncbi:heavy metal-associated isoprenylated plant protein 3 [Eucalyptus grandis]|nr:heavy metal-associated isoprenylated plant protein 3 [Eucalyptus grandis]